MRRCLMIVALALACGIAAWAQPKVAVLDAVVPDNIDQSVVLPVTEKIVERLVISGRYTVLDRANVEQVLSEREFQVSGLVSDAEITEAGKYLGADFVVVAKVQRVGDTYFLSAKMIAVKTGVIANQTSAESEGKLSTLIGLASKVGDVLSGGTVLAPSAADPDTKTVVAPPPKTTAPPAAKPVAAVKKSADDRIGTRLYIGFGSGSQDITENDLDYSFAGGGFDMYALFGFWNRFCAVGNLTYLDASDDGGAQVTSFDFGIGYARPIGIFMPWAALKFGGAALTVGDNDYSGSEFALDLGADIRLGSLLGGVRYQFQATAFSADGYADVDAAQNTFWFMLGYRL